MELNISKMHFHMHKIYSKMETGKWKFLYFLCRKLLPIKKNRICLVSWNGAHFNCNPKAIALYLNKLNLNHNYDIVVVVNNPRQYKKQYQGIRFVATYSLQHIVCQSTCKVFVSNVRAFFFIKRQMQYYIQTWHGTGPKKSEKDSINVLSKEYIDIAIRDCQQTDLMLSGSSFQTNWIKKSTWYTGRILESGFPRYDDFFNKEISENLKHRVFHKYKLPNSTKLVMYAPTFRSLDEIENYGFDVCNLLKALHAKFGGDWKLLLRFHPNVASLSLPNMFAKCQNLMMINVTSYDDMQDLLCAADVLITDFSSVSTEFFIQKKPCFLYAPDFNTYIRGLYFEPNQMPFPFAETEHQLIVNIEKFNEDEYLKKLNYYSNFLGMFEKGTASKAVVGEINKMLCLNIPD